ncbi:MAG TPA: carboxypeptidase regulatory-like domain-containing protein [Gemmatimonadaceae bacterium]|nr:carboxypeptidase regulatory-like domain-containing protein [Gemmatimonadaceae bacterium]
MNKKRLLIAAFASLLPSLSPLPLASQGVTTSTISARVKDASGNARAGVRVTAVHEPSGSVYQGRTRDDGRATLPGMRVGGPYTVTASGIGFESQTQPNVFLTLGQTADLQFVMRTTAVQIQEVTVTAAVGADKILNSSRTGAATTVSREALATLPTITGKLESIVRLTPQFGGCSTGTGCSLAGQDGRMNNISVDGTAFNNSFGLGGQPGDRTNVAPISLSAVEQMQVDVAPYDVRQGNFVGANINTVTRSGTNRLQGSIGYSRRDQSLVGKKAGRLRFDPGVFKYKNLGGWLGGPIIPNRLFFFGSIEDESLTQPGTTWLANTGTQTVAGNITRVRASSLDSLSTFLKNNFSYDTGPYQGYNNQTPAHRFLGKLDFNLNDQNKFVLRYNRLISSADILESNSASLGVQGNRRTNANSLNFSNSNYGALENIESTVGELNSTIGNGMANSLIIGYTRQNESRKPKGQFFPLVDIQEGAFTYTSFGFEPFTPDNLLFYNTLQFQDNFTKYTANHDFTFGVSVEKYHSENTFFPGSQSVYVYNSLADWYTDANGYLANPARTVSPVTLARFQVRYNNIPGQDKPVQPLEVLYSGIYAQDEWRATQNLKLNLGVRFDIPKFKNTAFDNVNADQLFWRDEKGNTVQYNTGKLPDTKVTISPRLGINWDVNGDRSVQFRGGTGIFSGRPAYVWISNQIGNTGVLTGFDQFDATTTRPFNPDPNHYKPTTITGAPAASYELALTDPNFRFPKLWRTDIGVDKLLPLGLIGTVEYMYNRDIDGIYYINANLPAAQSAFVGADSRLRWVGLSCKNPTPGPCQNRINNAAGNIVARNIVMKNQNVGRSWNIDGSLERPFSNGLFVKAAYNFGVAKNTIDPGSIASGSWNGNPQAGDPNNPGLSYSANSPGHRFFIATSYRKEYFSFGATTLSLFFDAHTNGNTSYTFANDLNGDGVVNDLIYIPRDVLEMNFSQFTCPAKTCGTDKTFTSADQANAWEAFIQQDDYLRTHRGQYSQRNAIFFPIVKRADFSIQQELFTDFARRRNSFQMRADIVNVGNLLNKNWGTGQRILGGNGQILTDPGVDALGRATYRLKVVNSELINKTFEPTAGRADVFEVQLGFRYTFN